MSKCNKNVVNGRKFASKAEATRYQLLSQREKAGQIRNLICRYTFLLVQSVKFKTEKRKTKAIRYFASFRYYDTARQEWVVEDVKSPVSMTPEYIRSRQMLLAFHGVDVEVIAA